MITQEDIDMRLGFALENGYFTDLASWSVLEIVGDLLLYNSDVEDATIEELTPFVKAWYDAQMIGDSQAGKAADC